MRELSDSAYESGAITAEAATSSYSGRNGLRGSSDGNNTSEVTPSALAKTNKESTIQGQSISVIPLQTLHIIPNTEHEQLLTVVDPTKNIALPVKIATWLFWLPSAKNSPYRTNYIGRLVLPRKSRPSTLAFSSVALFLPETSTRTPTSDAMALNAPSLNSGLFSSSSSSNTTTTKCSTSMVWRVVVLGAVDVPVLLVLMSKTRSIMSPIQLRDLRLAH